MASTLYLSADGFAVAWQQTGEWRKSYGLDTFEECVTHICCTLNVRQATSWMIVKVKID